MKIKKAIVYFISFFSLSLMFTVCYYLSYKNALKDFNESAVERNKELLLALENNGMLQLDNEQNNTNSNVTNDLVTQNTIDNAKNTAANNSIENSNMGDETIPVDTIKEDTIIPNTEYILQTYNIKTGNMEEEILPTPSYLVGLTRDGVIEYLYQYMQDLPWNEFEKGLTSFELVEFSKDSVTLKKTYNEDMVEYKYFIKSQNGTIVVYYGDQKTVYEYTGVSVDGLSQYEQLKLEQGIFVKDLEELYAVLENYSS